MLLKSHFTSFFVVVFVFVDFVVFVEDPFLAPVDVFLVVVAFVLVFFAVVAFPFLVASSTSEE